MALGLNRQNDTPIGGADEFRGNMDVSGFTNGDAVVFDGTKFVPGATDVTARAFGGLSTSESPGHIADGGLIQPWNSVTPIGGTPQQIIVDTVLGTLTGIEPGIYRTDFSCTVSALTNNENYVFTINFAGVDTPFRTLVVGSNAVSAQSITLIISQDVVGGQAVGISVSSDSGNATFNIISATLGVERIS